MPGPPPCHYRPCVFCIVGRGLDRLTAHNERRQPAKLARSCGCLPCRGKHCSLPDFAPLNRGPTLTTPHLHRASRTPPPTTFTANLPPCVGEKSIPPAPFLLQPTLRAIFATPPKEPHLCPTIIKIRNIPTKTNTTPGTGRSSSRGGPLSLRLWCGGRWVWCLSA